MDRYMDTQLATAKEFLETGVELQLRDMILKSIGIYKNIKPLIQENKDKERWNNVSENAIRACSAMCIMDPNNSKMYLDEASMYNPEHPVILNNYGFVYYNQLADWDKSIDHYERCLAKDPTYMVAYLGIIDVYRSLRHHKIELEYCKKAVKHCPQSPEIYNCLGLAYLHCQKYSSIFDMVSIFEKGLSLNPSDETRAKLYVNLGHINGILGSYFNAIEFYLKSIAADPKHQPAYQNILLNLHYINNDNFNGNKDEVSNGNSEDIKVTNETTGEPIGNKYHMDMNKEKNQKILRDFMMHFKISHKCASISQVIREFHHEFTRIIYPKTDEKVEKDKENNENNENIVDLNFSTRKIVIGYLTSDLVDHAVSYFSSVLYGNYNRDCFDVYIYSNNVYDAGTIANIPCTAYRCVKNASAADCCEQIKKDKIDILIDLSGHTAGNRLDVFAQNPAKICLSYLGYPDDTGFKFAKRISDKYTEKANMNEKNTTLQMDRLFICYTPKHDYQEHVKSYNKFKPGVSTVTFGCFAKLQKINSNVIDLWKKILEKVPKSRFILNSKYFANEKVAKEWKDKFAPFEKRVFLFKGTPTTEKHMELYKYLDIHLDTFPYSGTTITTECLYMNVPVITLSEEREGTAHVSRVSGSILKSLGLEVPCVAKTKDEYVQKSIAMISLIPNLPSCRKRFLKGEISDKKHFMEAFEKLLSDAYIESSRVSN